MKHCESCHAAIEEGHLCARCQDESGQLQDFSDIFDRMVKEAMQEDAQLSRAEAEKAAMGHMASMPAWKGHPDVVDHS